MLVEPNSELGGPIDDSQRIALLDVVRGFAILGLALVKAADFSPNFWMTWPSAVDRHVAWFEENFLADKFFTLFAILFGIGFSIQLNRAAARQAAFPRYFVRRSFVLLAIGLIHGLLIWSGDILAGYAIVSFALLLFRNVSKRNLLLGACIAWFSGHLIWIVRINVLHLPRPSLPDEAVATAVLAGGSALQILRYQAGQTLDYLWRGITGPAWMTSVLFLFLIGLYLECSGTVRRLAGDRAFCRRALIIAALLAAIAWGADPLVSSQWPAGELPILRRVALNGLWQFRTIGLSATYALLLSLFMLRRKDAALLLGLAAVGRTALSNYMLQSVVFVLIYYNYGLALYGHITPLPAMLLSAAVYSGELLLSVWWLRRYKFGPLEWVWRSLTYGHTQPFRRSLRVSNFP
jgi:uncharacterized protein